MAPITSRHHPIVKTFRNVWRGNDTRLALLDGWHLLDEALRAAIAIHTIAIEKDVAAADPLIRRAHEQGARIVELSTAVMTAVSPVRTPSGVVTLVERQTTPLATMLDRKPALLVLAMDMQDPGNVGAIIRSAEAGGATGVLFGGASADPWGWKALRAAMGSTLRVPILQVKEASPLVDELQVAGIRLLATVPRDGRDMHRVDRRGPVVLMLGGEGAGLPAVVFERASERMTIPMEPPVESLNAAVAAALLIYEARRQRQMGSSYA